MRASQSIAWAELRVGLLVVSALAVLGIFIFAASEMGRWFTPRAHYVTYLPDVAGLQVGSPVRLVGYEVGSVERIGLSEFRDDPARHAEVRFVVYGDFREDIRGDSEASVTTEGLLGQSVLEVSRGVRGDPLPEGGVVLGVEHGSIKQIVQNVEALTREMRLLVADIRKDPKKYLNMKISLF